MLITAGFAPHPPIIVPCVGKGREREAQATVDAMKKLAQAMVATQPDILFVLSPHAGHSRTGLPLFVSDRYHGSFRRFGVAQPVWEFGADQALLQQLINGATAGMRIEAKPQSDLDHGALVPLAYLAEAGFKGGVVLAGMPYMPGKKVAALGKHVAKLLHASPSRVGLLISGDLSHCLSPDAPNGYSPFGKQYDDAFVGLMQAWDAESLLNFDHVLAEKGAQDSLWPAQFLVGALADFAVSPKFLSYEGPFGVGYLVQGFEF